jgi:hypothetical protein
LFDSLLAFFLSIAFLVAVVWIFDLHEFFDDSVSAYTVHCVHADKDSESCDTLHFSKQQFRAYPETQQVIWKHAGGELMNMSKLMPCTVWDEEYWICMSEETASLQMSIINGEYDPLTDGEAAMPKYKWVWHWFRTPKTERKGSIF